MIKINNVTKKYGDTTILSDSSYEFPQKGIVCVMGASGGGKTTLFNLLAGFDTDYEGEIVVGGVSISALSSDALCRYRKDNVGFVFQNYHLLSGYTVLENVMLAGELTEQTKEESIIKAKALLERLGIADKANQKSENLSGGQKQRAAIARAVFCNPQILFADEPTGALDRAASNEIMNLLRELSKERLVVVITHDRKICDFADEIIFIKDGKIVEEKASMRYEEAESPLIVGTPAKTSVASHAAKNFLVHIWRYLAVSLAISIGMLTFLFSLSFGNVMDDSIDDFKQKNTAFNNGYIKGADDGTVLGILEKDGRLENIYYQYKLGEIQLSVDDKTEPMPEKFPAAKATEGMSYGAMPKQGMGEIALTPSLAKKFDSNIKNLIGKELVLEASGERYSLTICGIYNAGYDDFFVSSDVEQRLYASLPKQDNYSISYDVTDFDDIAAVSADLKTKGISAKSAAEEVAALQSTFDGLNKLFLIISILILGIGIFICAILLIKLQNTRYREIGLLSALGFRRGQINGMIFTENLLLATLVAVVNFVLLGGSTLLCKLINLPLVITGVQLFVAVVVTFIAILLLSGAASRKLLSTEPAEALRR